eukprot:552038-Pyramimonas_sp.AAC.1
MQKQNIFARPKTQLVGGVHLPRAGAHRPRGPEHRQRPGHRAARGPQEGRELRSFCTAPTLTALTEISSNLRARLLR